MDFQMSINLDNAAFRDDEEHLDPTDLARLLRQVAKRVEDGWNVGTCLDVNGNKVGRWEISE